MKRPNLFKFATSELSQDAFICWLISWAAPEHKAADAKLHQCAVDFVKALFAKHPQKKQPATIEKILVKKQDANIDILCIVNEKFVLLIEDKTRTINHGSQLSNYLFTIETRSYELDCIFPIYLKTHDQASYHDVIQKNKYQVFLRNDFISVLDRGHDAGIENAIFQDFRESLHKIQSGVDSYLNIQISSKESELKWNNQAWTGFFIRLQNELGVGLWGKVNNAAGGFMGFWWGGQNGKPYLQLEETKLCFKIKVDRPEDQKRLRTYWYTLIKNSAADTEFTLTKPERFGCGQYMTVIVAKGDYRKTKEDGCVDMAATVLGLKKIQSFLGEIHNLVN